MKKKLKTTLILLASIGTQNLYANFSLRDIERRCEVYKYSESYGELECSGSEFREIVRRCEVYFSDYQTGEFECRGSEFREIEKRCEVSMYSEEYGEIDC